MSDAVLYVVVVDTDAPRLIYHQYGKAKGEQAPYTFYTKCGIEVPRFCAHLRRDHADRLGRACKACFR